MMHRAQVEKAVLVQNPTIGCVNQEILQAVRENPGVFAGTAQVDPFLPGAQEELCRLADTGAFRALKMELSDDWGWLSIHPQEEFHYRQLYPFFDIASEKKLHVIFDTGATTGTAYQPEELEILAKDYPNLHFILEHQGYLTPQGNDMKYLQLLELGKLENVSFGISAAPSLLEEDYPSPLAMGMLQRVCNRVGAESLMWGTDCPVTLNRYTYQQMKDMILLHTPFLNGAQREKILYANADELFFK